MVCYEILSGYMQFVLNLTTPSLKGIRARQALLIIRIGSKLSV